MTSWALSIQTLSSRTALLLAGLVVARPAAAQSASAVHRREVPVGLDLYMPVPERNPLTAAKVALGRKLFFDSLLSRDRTRACATCHDPRRAFTDGRAVALGVDGREGTRSAPTLVNRGYGRSFFWDGRATTLEKQVLRPIQHRMEMDMTLESVLVRLTRDEEYPRLFQSAFGDDPDAEGLAQALASYVRTILSGNAPVDRYMAGELDAVSEEERQGLRIFRGKGNCTVCHVGPTFSDERFHNTGVAWRDGELLDEGRFAVTSEDEDRGAFKTPTLREIARTAPYMHDGSLATLEDVIEFYDRGGNFNPYLDAELRPLHLTDLEKGALIAFLRALSGQVTEGMGFVKLP